MCLDQIWIIQLNTHNCTLSKIWQNQTGLWMTYNQNYYLAAACDGEITAPCSLRRWFFIFFFSGHQCQKSFTSLKLWNIFGLNQETQNKMTNRDITWKYPEPNENRQHSTNIYLWMWNISNIKKMTNSVKSLNLSMRVLPFVVHLHKI